MNEGMQGESRFGHIRSILFMLWVISAIIWVLQIFFEDENNGFFSPELPIIGVSLSTFIFVIFSLPWVLPLFRSRQASKEGLGSNFCVNCGNALNQDARFCSKCGTRRN